MYKYVRAKMRASIEDGTGRQDVTRWAATRPGDSPIPKTNSRWRRETSRTGVQLVWPAGAGCQREARRRIPTRSRRGGESLAIRLDRGQKIKLRDTATPTEPVGRATDVQAARRCCYGDKDIEAVGGAMRCEEVLRTSTVGKSVTFPLFQAISVSVIIIKKDVPTKI